MSLWRLESQIVKFWKILWGLSYFFSVFFQVFWISKFSRFLSLFPWNSHFPTSKNPIFLLFYITKKSDFCPKKAGFCPQKVRFLSPKSQVFVQKKADWCPKKSEFCPKKVRFLCQLESQSVKFEHFSRFLSLFPLKFTKSQFFQYSVSPKVWNLKIFMIFLDFSQFFKLYFCQFLISPNFLDFSSFIFVNF